MPNAPLRVESLVKQYPSKGQGPVLAVNNVSFELKPGEVFGLLGPNGAGKTSIISVIVTLEKATSGRVWINGYDNQEAPREAKQNVGFVPQEIINHGYFDVYEILDFQSGYFGRARNKARIDYLLHELSLYEHRHKKVKQLSGGMKRRLLIAKALVHEPRLLLLDEPTAGVDIELRSQLWGFVKKLKSEGVTVLLTTHYLQEAELLCDRVGLLDKGELKMVGATHDLITQFTSRKVRIRSAGDSQTREHIIRTSQTIGDLLREQNIQLQNVEDLTVCEGTLEDAFRQVIYKK
jgi:ABC-2 type transport system ATP-binding protein